MPRYTIQTPTGTYDVDSPTELSDADAYALVASHGDAAETSTPEQPRQALGVVDNSEPSTYLGGFWKGIKDYAKDLVTDPRTMGMVGAGAAAALVPATGGVSALAIPALGAMAGAGTAIAGRQLRSGTPEDALDTVGRMGEEGLINGALAAVPMGSRALAPKLAARAERLASMSALERHAPAALTAAVTHNPALAGAVEVAQSPLANRWAGRALDFVGNDLPDAAASVGRKASGLFRGGGSDVDPASLWLDSTARQVHYGGLDGDIPDYHGRAPAYEPQPVDPRPVTTDRYMPNVGADSHEPAPEQINFPVGQSAVAQPYGSGGPMRVQQPMSDQAYTNSIVDRYAPNVSGAQPGGAADVAPAEDLPQSLRSLIERDRYEPSASGYEPQRSEFGNEYEDLPQSLQSLIGRDRYEGNVSGFEPGASNGADDGPLVRSSAADVEDAIVRGSDAFVDAGRRPPVAAPERGSRGFNPIFDDPPPPAPEPPTVLRGADAYADASTREPIAAPDRGGRAVVGAGYPPSDNLPYQPNLADVSNESAPVDSFDALERALHGNPSIDVLDGAAEPSSAAPGMRGGNAGAGRTPNLSMGDRASHVGEVRANMRRVEDVKSALRGLGFASSQADEAAQAATAATDTTEDAIRAALRQLASTRR